MIYIAHRGYSGKFPENTILAFEKAYECGSRIIEFDINLTKDKIPIILHDDTLDRTTKLKGRIQSYNYEQIKDIDAGSWKNKKFQNVKIPTLEELFKWAKDKKDLYFNIEIKSDAYTKNLNESNIELQVLNLIKKFKISKRVFISSFEIKILKRIRSLNSNIKLSILPENSNLIDGSIYKFIQEINPYSINLDSKIFTKNFYLELKDIDEKRELNKFLEFINQNKKVKFFTYTVNTRSLFNTLVKMNIDGIFTDYPNLFIKKGNKNE